MRVEVTYRWRVKWNGKWGATRWDATEDDIRREHPEATPIEGTRKERAVPDTPEERAAQHVSLTLGHLQQSSPPQPAPEGSDS